MPTFDTSFYPDKTFPAGTYYCASPTHTKCTGKIILYVPGKLSCCPKCGGTAFHTFSSIDFTAQSV